MEPGMTNQERKVESSPLGPGAPSGGIEVQEEARSAATTGARIFVPRHPRAVAAVVRAAPTQAGTTAHFVVSFDSSLGTAGQTIANAVLAVLVALFPKFFGYQFVFLARPRA